MKMLKILLRATEKQARANEMCWHGPFELLRFPSAHSSVPRVDLSHSLISALREHVVLTPFARHASQKRGRTPALTSAMT